jgi:hypothetical protein
MKVQYQVTVVFGQRIHMNVLEWVQTVTQPDRLHLDRQSAVPVARMHKIMVVHS